jgi:hypothetical protein
MEEYLFIPNPCRVEEKNIPNELPSCHAMSYYVMIKTPTQKQNLNYLHASLLFNSAVYFLLLLVLLSSVTAQSPRCLSD